MIDRRKVIENAALAVAAAAASGPALAMKVKVGGKTFPRDFLWGASTAGYQIEGNNVASDMWFIENRPQTIYAERSGDACNSFDLWRTDLDLVKNIGLNAYRFSLEWSRIEPVEGQFSMAMLDHYKAMIEGCRIRGVTPVVTFNHFSVPLWFAVQGGWTNDQSVRYFTRFCTRAARHLASHIGYASTLNEPNLSIHMRDIIPEASMAAYRSAYAAAAVATGTQNFSLSHIILPEDLSNATRNLIAAHKSARDAIKTVRSDLPVGVCLSMPDEQAAGPDSMRDSKQEEYFGAWLDAVKGDDYLGIQNYSRHIWGPKGKLVPPPETRRDASGRELYPASLANVARYAHARSGCPILVTEHGVNATDDTLRAWFIPASLRELRTAIGEGVPVKGYIHWSLLDNFEWEGGYKPLYGLVAVDLKTFKRTPKPSAAVLGRIAKQNAI